MSTPLSAAMKSWRAKIFVATWLSYFGFYFCRMPWAATKSDIGKEAGWGATALGQVDAAYLIAYAVGQFLASGMGTKLGPRLNVLLGMAVSIVVTALMGVTLTLPVVMGLVAINGLAQATGWSGNVGTMANWFHKHERGRVMGLWSTNFTVGSIAAPFAMAGVLALAASYGGDWRWCFYFGAAVLAIVWVQFHVLQRTRPEDVGLAPVDDPVTAVDEAVTERQPVDSPPAKLELSRGAWINLLLVGGFYFFAKLVRYAVWLWAPFFLARNYGMSSSESNLLAIAFSVAGVPGIYLTGYISDKYLNARRAGISMVMMVAMTAMTGLLVAFGGTSVTVFTVLLAAVGFTLFGPDALLSGAGAMDIGGRRAATFAAAFISGIGSSGPVVGSLAIGRLYDKNSGDLTAVFVLLFVSAVLGTLFCGALVLRNRRGGKGI